MVKIPEQPGSYRPGDVVNGHVLTERGHWIPLADAPARGARPRRYLAPQVSTLRAADSPSELANENRPPAARSAPAAGSAPAARPTPPSGQLPRVQARPSASRPAPAPRPVAPHGARRSTLRRVFTILLVTFIIVRMIAAIAGATTGPGAAGPGGAPHGVVVNAVGPVTGTPL